MDGVHLGDVKLVEGNWRIAGNTGYALVVTGSGTRTDIGFCTNSLIQMLIRMIFNFMAMIPATSVPLHCCRSLIQNHIVSF